MDFWHGFRLLVMVGGWWPYRRLGFDASNAPNRPNFTLIGLEIVYCFYIFTMKQTLENDFLSIFI